MHSVLMTVSIMASSYVSNELLFKMRLFQTIVLQEIQHNFFFLHVHIHLFGCTGSQLRDLRFSVAACEI